MVARSGSRALTVEQLVRHRQGRTRSRVVHGAMTRWRRRSTNIKARRSRCGMHTLPCRTQSSMQA
jgi:hypothetical protein